jgi:tetratricopeptide (TPR) repeat protein
VRAVGPGRFELTHPPCVAEREDDYAEAMEVWRSGEPEEAREILRFALEGCGDNLWIHVALGRLAEQMGDDALAQGHYGYAVELARRPVERLAPGSLDPGLKANKPFYDACAGLAAVLERKGERAAAEAIRGLARRLGQRGGHGRPVE